LENKSKISLDWIDGLKAFAIIGILWNHTVELFGTGPWFSNPSYNWPDFQTRIDTLFPIGNNLIIQMIKFIGWLGDMGPGVFILTSGFALTLSASRKDFKADEFYLRRFGRIFPTYFLIHLIVNIFLIITKVNGLGSLISGNNLLSIFGLRFNNGLFFYLNPSWWFIWLLIQLYAVFPLLYRYLTKHPDRFLIITLILTILFRLSGILHFTYSNNLYYWMTGLFGGTRLFEFTIGMYIAIVYLDKASWIHTFLSKPNKVFLFSIMTYLIGFISSWTYTGSLISNIFITIGLSGIFYSFYFYIQKSRVLSKSVQFIGKNSFVTFLIHQPFMIFIALKFDGILMVLLIILVIVSSILLGSKIENLANHIYKLTLNLIKRTLQINLKLLKALFWTSFAVILIGNIFLPLLANGKFIVIFKILLLGFITYGCVYFSLIFKNKNHLKFTISLILIISVITYLLPNYLIGYYSFAIFISLFFNTLIITVLKKWITPLVSLTILAGVTLYLEFTLNSIKPIETGRWGEYPALQIDSLTNYSLIPNKTTRLKYNNYDYILRTNSLGFASPEINLAIKDTNSLRIFLIGDAFTMPEGMEYEYSYPALLEQNLKKIYPTKKIEVINGGVTGYGPNEMLAELKKYIDVVKPDIVINEFFINEFEEINLTKEERQKSIGFFVKDKFYSKYIPVQLCLHLGKNYRKIFNLPDRKSNYWKSLLPLYEKKSIYYSDSVINKLDKFFSSVDSLKNQKHFAYYLLYVPGQIEVSLPQHIDYYPYMVNIEDSTKFDFEISHAIIRTICDKNKIELWDTKEYLVKSPVQPLYYTESWHWNKEGHITIADYITNKLIK